MANKKWIQKANTRMKEKGTVGSFTNYCGGRVTQSCIDRAKNSDDPTLRRRAQFAENMRGIGTRKGREGIRKEREKMFVGGELLGKIGDVAGSGEFGAVAGAAGSGTGGLALKGAAKGAALGAKLGTIVPGIGNIIGAGIGAVAGGLRGLFKGKKAKKEAEEAKAKAEADEKKRQADLLKMQYQAQYDATVQNMPQENYENVNTGVAYKKGGRKTEEKAQYGMRTEAVEGKRRLPGGLELKLKNGAKKYVGNKHDEAGNGSDSGIILEHSTKNKKGLEVEDGELEVKDDQGAYIVSNYLKNPATGNTLAKDLEAELKGLDKTKHADKIKQINKKYIDLNEELKDKKKEPDEIKAYHGARRVYQEGGGKRPIKTYEEFVAAYPKFTDHVEAYKRYIIDMTQDQESPESSALAQTYLDEIYAQNLADGHEELYTGENALDKGSRGVGSLNMVPAGAEVRADSLPMSQLEVAKVVAPEIDKSLKTPGKSIGDGVKAGEKDGTYEALLDELNEMDGPSNVPSEVPIEDAVEEEVAEAEKKGGKFKDFLGKAKDLLGNIPRGYGQGTMLQALGAAAYLKNQDDPMAPMLAPSYMERIPPAEYKSFAPERAAATAAFNAQNNVIDTSIAGPAAIAARQAALASQTTNMSKIATQDIRDRAQINQLNANNELRVALANQKAYNDTNRANATAKYAAELEKFKNKYGALDKIGDVTAQALKDRRAAQSERLVATATQIGGAFDRAEERYGFNKLFPFFGQDKSVEGGITAEDAQALALLNGQTEGGEDVENTISDEEQSKKGGRRNKKKRYIKRKGTVRRRRQIKKK